MAEKAIIRKMTFYDVVTLIVPSALVCYEYNWKPMGSVNTWEGYIAQLGVLLMVGLLLKSVGALWSGFWFRNNTDIIKQERQKVTKVGGENQSCGFLDILFFDPVKYILGPITKCFYVQDKRELDNYYDKYENAYTQEYYGKRIDALESHVAFLQTWTVALVVYAFEKSKHICCIVVAYYVCVVIMLALQRKIYNMIWESKKKGE